MLTVSRVLIPGVKSQHSLVQVIEEVFMHQKKIFITVIAAGLLLSMTAGLWLSTASPVSAQCGSQASSCKNCHQVQEQDPVNADGTGWHTSHAFGDFCYICHAGNNQAADKAQAHTGMVPPLSDIKASCQQCHLDDLTELAQVYATKLGVELGNSNSVVSTTDPVAETEITSNEVEAVSAPVVTELEVDDPNQVNYTERYEEIVLGKKPINIGNAILICLIGAVAVGGGGFIIKNEKWLDFSSLNDTKNVDGVYATDVVEMLPSIAELKPESRKTLKKILGNPNGTEKVLELIDTVVTSEGHEEKTK
jgi:hypothetical protein